MSTLAPTEPYPAIANRNGEMHFLSILTRFFRRIAPVQNRAFRQRGVASTELLVVLPALLILGLGGLQLGLVNHAKSIVSYATFESARKGAVNHALAGEIRDEFGLRIAPVFGGDGWLIGGNE